MINASLSVSVERLMPNVGTEGPKTPAFESVLNKLKKTEGATESPVIDPMDPMNSLDKMIAANSAPVFERGLKSFANSWAQNNDMMEQVMKSAMSGHDFSPSELIGLQGAIYKTTFEMTTIAETVKSGSNAVKTTMQTNV